jgi:hypothetical protein
MAGSGNIIALIVGVKTLSDTVAIAMYLYGISPTQPVQFVFGQCTGISAGESDVHLLLIAPKRKASVTFRYAGCIQI